MSGSGPSVAARHRTEPSWKPSNSSSESGSGSGSGCGCGSDCDSGAGSGSRSDSGSGSLRAKTLTTREPGASPAIDRIGPAQHPGWPAMHQVVGSCRGQPWQGHGTSERRRASVERSAWRAPADGRPTDRPNRPTAVGRSERASEAISQNSCMQPGCLHAFRAACMHVNGIFSQPASQPARGPRPPDMARTVEMGWLPGARMATPGARAQGAVAGDILGRVRARARVSRSKFHKIRAPQCHSAVKMGTRTVVQL